MTTKSTTVITRKDMKEPDKFQQAAGQAATWVAARRKQVVTAGVIAGAVIVLLVVLLSVQSIRARHAGANASEFLSTVGGAVSTVPVGDAVPTFPTEEAKQRAIIAAADQVLSGGGSDATALAALAKGDAHFSLREWEPAKAAYGRFLDMASRGDSLRFGALEGLALVAEAEGKLDDAAKGWARVGSEAPAFADRADLERARVLAQAGKADEARQILTAFAEQHKQSPLTGEASERLARLGGK
jgi:hypothetical protein